MYGEMLIWRELAHQNWWNYSSPNITASWCWSNQMPDSWLVYFDSCCTRCYCCWCWCCYSAYCSCRCHCYYCCWRSAVDSFLCASEDRHNHSRTRFYYYSNKTGLQHKIYIFNNENRNKIFGQRFLLRILSHCYWSSIWNEQKKKTTIKFPKNQNKTLGCDSHTCDYIVDMQNTPSDKHIVLLASPSQTLESVYCTLHNGQYYRTVYEKHEKKCFHWLINYDKEQFIIKSWTDKRHWRFFIIAKMERRKRILNGSEIVFIQNRN